jgi:hypothetical protein
VGRPADAVFDAVAFHGFLSRFPKKNPLPALGLITDFFLVWMVRLGHYQPIIPAAEDEVRYEDANKANNEDKGAGNHRVPDRIDRINEH